MMQFHVNVHQITHELEAALPEVRSLWFPNHMDLERWNDSGSSLYLRKLRGNQIEIGPRLSSLNAARLCPVIRGQLIETSAHQTTLIGRLRFPRETEFLIIFWSFFILLWAAALRVQVGNGDLPWGWWVWWFILTFFFSISIVIGRVMGRHHLLRGLQDFKERIERETEQI